MNLTAIPKKNFTINISEFIKFAVVGASGVIVNMGIYYSLTRFFSVRYEIASPIAIEVSILFNFFLNNLWTFKNRNTLNNFLNRLLKFHTVSLISGFINYITFLSLINFAGVNDIFANLSGIAVAVTSNFILNSRWTWKKDEYV